MTVDDIITKVTQAASWNDAYVIMSGVTSKKTLLALADQLYVEDADRMSANGVRKAIIAECRA